VLRFADPMSQAHSDRAPFDWGAELPRLETKRTVLRQPRRDDVPALFSIFGDPQVVRYWSTTAMRHVAEAEELLREIGDLFRRRSLFQWGIARRDDDRLVGTATLFRLDPVHRRCEIGFALGRDAWGRGLMTEALTTLFDFAFDSLALRRLEADVDPRNEPCLRLLERLGFRREGLLRERYYVGGEIQDSVLLGLLAAQWRGGESS